MSKEMKMTMKMVVLVYPLIGVMLVSYGKTLPSLPDKKLVVSPWARGCLETRA